MLTFWTVNLTRRTSDTYTEQSSVEPPDTSEED